MKEWRKKRKNFYWESLQSVLFYLLVLIHLLSPFKEEKQVQLVIFTDGSLLIRSECYFSLDRKVTKRSRLHLVRYSASCVRCRLWTRYAQTAQPPGALYRCFALRSPDEAFHRTLCVLWRLPILPVKSESFCSISTGIGHPKRKHSFLEKA